MTSSLDELRQAAAGCRACDLWKTGTQTVFGEGRESAEVMMVGDQPGGFVADLRVVAQELNGSH